MPKALDLTGQRFDRLIVIGFDKIKRGSSGKSVRYWKCRCDCGNLVSVSTKNLRQQNTKSCGCLKTDYISEINYKHGKSKTRLYSIWKTMKKRCYYKKHSNYKNYGERGIIVCDEWLNERGFENFASWSLANGYSEELTLDRIDTDGNYCPENCRWATWQEQQINRRNNRRFYYKGKNLLAKEWSNLMGIDLRILLNRLYTQNWSIERALTEPVKKHTN